MKKVLVGIVKAIEWLFDFFAGLVYAIIAVGVRFLLLAISLFVVILMAKATHSCMVKAMPLSDYALNVCLLTGILFLQSKLGYGWVELKKDCDAFFKHFKKFNENSDITKNNRVGESGAFKNE